MPPALEHLPPPFHQPWLFTQALHDPATNKVASVTTGGPPGPWSSAMANSTRSDWSIPALNELLTGEHRLCLKTIKQIL